MASNFWKNALPFSLFWSVHLHRLSCSLEIEEDGHFPYEKGSIFCAGSSCFSKIWEAYQVRKAMQRSTLSSFLPFKHTPSLMKVKYKRNARKHLDRYTTSSAATESVLPYLEQVIDRSLTAVKVFADICGASNDQVAVILQREAGSECRCITNDIDPSLPATSHLDSADPDFPSNFQEIHGTNLDVEVMVTSPPYNRLRPVLSNALSVASCCVAVKLPCHFLDTGRRPGSHDFLGPHSGLPLCRILSSEVSSDGVSNRGMKLCVSIRVFSN